MGCGVVISARFQQYNIRLKFSALTQLDRVLNTQSRQIFWNEAEAPGETLNRTCMMSTNCSHFNNLSFYKFYPIALRENTNLSHQMIFFYCKQPFLKLNRHITVLLVCSLPK